MNSVLQLKTVKKNVAKIVEAAKSEFKMSRSSVANYLKRLTANGLIKTAGGLYWVGNE